MVRLRSPAPMSPHYGLIFGGFPERPKGADCKSVVTDFGGSNPPSSTNLTINADVAELADAPDLGSGAYGVGVRLPSSAPIEK